MHETQSVTGALVSVVNMRMVVNKARLERLKLRCKAIVQ